MNTKKKITILSILIALILVVTTTSITYAIWSSKHVTESNIVQSGCLNIKFTQDTADINAPRIAPGVIYYLYLILPNNDNEKQETDGTELSNSTTEIKENSYYAFIITNTCNTQASYNINMETLNGTDLDSKYLSIYINAITVGNKSNINDINASDFDNKDNVLISKEDLLANYPLVNTTLDNALYSNNLYRGILKGNETHFFELFALLPYDSNNIEAQEKTWMSKITVNSTTASPIKVSFDTNGGEVDKTDKIVYSNSTYGELPVPTKKGYQFKYWYLDDDETKGINENTIVSKNNNHTLKAKYASKDDKTLLMDWAFKEYIKNINNILPNDYNGNINIFPYYGYLNIEDVDNEYIVEDVTAPIRLQEVVYEDNVSESYPIYILRDNVRIDDDTNINIYYYSNGYINMREDYFGNTEHDLIPIKSVTSIKRIDLSEIDTSYMFRMDDMFRDCSSLEELNISSFDTSNVTYMDHMFEDCSSLTTLDLSNFNTENVESMDAMFHKCTNLNNINIKNFSNNNLESVSSMFYKCTSLHEIDLSGFNNKTMYDINMFCESSVETVIGYTPSEGAFECYYFS